MKNPQGVPLKGILYMMTSALFFSVMGTLVKSTTGRLPFMEAVFFRSLIMLLVLAPVMWIKKIPFQSQNRLLMMLRVTAGFTAVCLSFYVLHYLKLADASLLNRTSIPFVALLSVFFLRERVSTLLITYTLLSLVGAALIIKPSFEFINLPGLLGLLAGFLAAVAYVSIRELHDTEHSLTVVFHFALFGTCVSAIIGHSFFLWPEGIEWAALLGIGLCGTIAQTIMTYAYKYAEAAIVSPFSYATVIFSALWGFLFWQEIPDPWSILGAILLVACGIGIMQLKKNRVALTASS